MIESDNSNNYNKNIKNEAEILKDGGVQDSSIPQIQKLGAKSTPIHLHGLERYRSIPQQIHCLCGEHLSEDQEPERQ